MPDARYSWGQKFERASTHFSQLERQWGRYTKSVLNPGRLPSGGGYSSGVTVWRDGNTWNWALGEVADPPDAEWSLVVGDCVQNLRSALDHLIWHLSTEDERKSHPKQIQFPITLTKQDWASFGSRSIQGLVPAARKAVLVLQPFTKPSADRPDPLAVLNELSNLDKHRRIHLTHVTVEAANLSVAGRRVPTLYSARGGTRVRSRMLLLRATADQIEPFSPSDQQPLTPELWMTISFADSGIASKEGVMGTLRRIRSTVGEILDDLQAFVGI
jgi:hypothetical protein